MTQRAYKYRIYPDAKQRDLLARTFGCVRAIWNHNVEIFNSYDKELNPKPIPKTSTELRNDPDLAYMLEVSAAALQQKQRDFLEFRKQFFNSARKKKVGRPQFHDKRGQQSYRLDAVRFDVFADRIRLEKIGFVEAVIHSYPPAGSRFINVTVSRDTCGSYFASVLVDEDIKPRFAATGRTVGVDVGLKHFATLSTGEEIENPRWLRKNQAQLRTAQKHLSRKRKGSVRREKCKLVVAKLHRKVARQRAWFQHNLSLKLVREFDVISAESLNIAGMLKNRHLARSISDAGWGQFLRMLEYKAQWNQRQFVQVSMWFPSTIECTCGVRNSHLKLSQRVWTCAACGLVHERDLHASCKLDIEGLRILAARKDETAQGVDCAQRTQRNRKTDGTRRRQAPLKRAQRTKNLTFLDLTTIVYTERR